MTLSLLKENKNFLKFQAILFICCFLIIAFYNRFTGDDFCGIAAVNNHGIVGATEQLYFKWEGAYMQGLVYYSFCYLFQNSNTLFLYNFVVLVCFVLSFYFFLNNLVNNYFNIPAGKMDLLIVTLILVSTLYFTTSEFGEVWYWLCGSSSYTIPLIFLFLAGGLALYKTRNPLNLFLITLLSFVFSGFRINYTICLMAVLLLGLFFKFFQSKKLDQIFALMFLGSLIGFFVFVMAPGNAIRLEKYHNGMGILSKINDFHFLALLKGVMGFLFIKTLHTFYSVLILFPIIMFGLDGCFFDDYNKIKKYIFRVFFLFFFFLVISFLLMYVTTGSYFGTSSGSYRTLFILDFVWVLIVALVMLYVRLRFQATSLFLSFKKPAIKLCLFLICLLPFLLKIYFAFCLLPNYAAKYDERDHEIKSASSSNNYVVVEALPPATFSFNLFDEKKPVKYLLVGIPGNLLFLNDAKKDSLNWVNGCMEERYHNVKIRIK